MQLDASTPRDQARRLRRDQTETERRLWARLRARQLCGAKFRRQHPIGRFVADFCCLEHGLVVELDGGQHFESRQMKRDAKRDAFLRLHSYCLRFRFGFFFVVAGLKAARGSYFVLAIILSSVLG